MAEPEVDEDSAIDGEISAAHGDTSIETMRKVYTDEFAAAFEPLDRLSDAISAVGEKAIKWLHRLTLRNDHRDGSLARKIAEASRRQES